MSDRDNFWGCLNSLDSILRLGLMLLFVVAIGFFYAFGPTVTLTCTRQGTSDVFCEFKTQAFILGGSLGGILHVRGAVNEQKCDGTGCKYRVVLETADGKRPLVNEYTSGSKADFVNKLNAFIADQSRTKIELTQSQDLSCLIPIGLIVVASIVLFGAYWIRGKSV